MDLAAGVFQLFDATSKQPKASIPLSQIHDLQKSEARDFAFQFTVILHYLLTPQLLLALWDFILSTLLQSTVLQSHILLSLATFMCNDSAVL